MFMKSSLLLLKLITQLSVAVFVCMIYISSSNRGKSTVFGLFLKALKCS